MPSSRLLRRWQIGRVRIEGAVHCVDERLRRRELVDGGKPRELGGISRGQLFCTLSRRPSNVAGISPSAFSAAASRLASSGSAALASGNGCALRSRVSSSSCVRSRTCSLSTLRHRVASSSSVLQNARFFELSRSTRSS